MNRDPRWLTAAELAGLPGLPKSKRAVNALAGAEGWARRFGDDGAPLARRRIARGGGIEYHASLLPPEAQERISLRVAAAQTATSASGGTYAAVWSWYDQQPVPMKSKAEERLALLVQVEALIEGGMAKTAAMGAIGRRSGVSSRSIASWFAMVADVPNAHRIPFLAPRYRGKGDAHGRPAAIMRPRRDDGAVDHISAGGRRLYKTARAAIAKLHPVDRQQLILDLVREELSA